MKKLFIILLALTIFLIGFKIIDEISFRMKEINNSNKGKNIIDEIDLKVSQKEEYNQLESGLITKVEEMIDKIIN